jgi:hypothetical protein
MPAKLGENVRNKDGISRLSRITLFFTRLSLQYGEASKENAFRPIEKSELIWSPGRDSQRQEKLAVHTEHGAKGMFALHRML